MKQTTTNDGRDEATLRANFAVACRACGRKVLSQLNRIKAVILAESEETLAGRRHLVQLALNEAEGLAWQTMYPHLVFPTLAREKVQAVAAWNARQRQVRSWLPQLAVGRQTG